MKINLLNNFTAVKGNLADNPMGIKVGLLETTQQKTSIQTRGALLKGRRVATSRANTEGRQIKCE